MNSVYASCCCELKRRRRREICCCWCKWIMKLSTLLEVYEGDKIFVFPFHTPRLPTLRCRRQDLVIDIFTYSHIRTHQHGHIWINENNRIIFELKQLLKNKRITCEKKIIPGENFDRFLMLLNASGESEPTTAATAAKNQIRNTDKQNGNFRRNTFFGVMKKGGKYMWE